MPVIPVTTLYIDPAATTVIITSISGIVIAVGATAVILWRKAKKKVAAALHIDENANKEVEDELVINEAQDESSNSDAE
jgi:MFS superfamily sulfate permease-like transporter